MKRPVRIALQVAVVAAIYGALFWVLADKWDALIRSDFQIRWGVLAAATATVLVGFLGWFFLWYALTRRLRCALSVGETAAAYAISQLAKYIPGKVWLFVARYHLYRRAGIARGRIGMAMMLEAFYLLASPAAVLLGASLFSTLAIPVIVRWAAAGLLGVGLVLLHPRIVERLINAALRRAKKPAIRVEQSYGELLGFLLAYSAVNLVLAGAFYLLIVSVYPLPFSRFADVCLSTTATGLVSMMALFAPAGAGVREAGFYETLRLFIPDSIAIVVALLNRVWATSIELCLVGAVIVLTRAPRLAEIRRDVSDEASDG